MVMKKFIHNKVEHCALTRKPINTNTDHYSVLIDYDKDKIMDIKFYNQEHLKDLIERKGKLIQQEIMKDISNKSAQLIKNFLPETPKKQVVVI